ncbi:Rapid ALkalinization Factor protein, partial [Dioscorea alata]
FQYHAFQHGLVEFGAALIYPPIYLKPLFLFGGELLAVGDSVQFPAEKWAQKLQPCSGSISYEVFTSLECEEFGLSSREIYRRILAVGNHISYGALEPDTTPCSQPGMSYYNCRAGAEANPYRRGCNALTQCRS